LPVTAKDHDPGALGSKQDRGGPPDAGCSASN